MTKKIKIEDKEKAIKDTMDELPSDEERYGLECGSTMDKHTELG